MTESTSATKYVLIDTDCGTDDALAIFMALQAHLDPKINFKVVGIVCVNGNTKIDNVCINVTRILDLLQLIDIPIFRGSDSPMIFPYEHSECPPFHGSDGFGDAEFPSIESRIESEPGVVAITRLAHEYKGKLSILALGPLTNLGMAIRLDPSIKNCIKEIYSMGGNIEGVGNTTVCAEFNFLVDPEAAYVVLSSYTCPKFIIPWEVCMRQAVQTYEWRFNEFTKINSPSSELINKIEQNILKQSKETNEWYPCDQVAAAALIDPEIMAETVKRYTTVELHGNHTRGLMVVDHPKLMKQSANVTIVTKINQELFRNMMIWGLGGTFYK